YLLSVVQEVGLVSTSETGHSRQTLWVVGQQSICFAKEHYCGIEQLPIKHQAKTCEQRPRVPSSGILHAPTGDRRINSSLNLVAVQITGCYTLSWSVLPASRGMHSLQQHALVTVLGHNNSRRANTHMWSPAVGIRTT